MEQYSAYKNSGIEWAREIPIGWEIKRVGYLIQNLTGFAFKSELFLFDGGIKVVRGDNVTEGSLRWGDKTRYWSEISPELERFLLQPEDILIGMDGSKVGKNYCQVEEEDLPLLLVQRVARLRSSENLSARFLYYNIGSNNFLYWVDINRTDPAIPHITSKNIKDYPLCLPPLPEQEAIAAYLDRKTKQIDDLIAKKERLIELKKEERAAIINQAVTKGLDPNVPMKDSGIEWLGEIPATWKVKRLKYVTNRIIDGAHFTPTYIDDGIPFLRVTDIQQETIDLGEVKRIPQKEHLELIKRCLPQKGDLLLSKNGTIGLTKVIDWEWEFSIFVSLCLIKFTEEVSPYFFSFLFQSNIIDQQLSESSKKTSVTNLHLDKIRELSMPVPPIADQQELIDYLTKITELYSTSEIKLHGQIDLLKEYKTTLISEAVTGKIKISNEQPTTDI